MNERKELIARLRDYTYEGDPRHLMEAAADMLEADAQPKYGWLIACDEEMICAHLGVANLSDSFESAKQKLGELIAWHVAVATDPAINGGLSLQPAVPQETCWCDEKNLGEPGVSCGDCPRDYAPQKPDNDEVICPACCTQFRAIPVNVQQLLLGAGFEPPFKSVPQPQRPRLLPSVCSQAIRNSEYMSISLAARAALLPGNEEVSGLSDGPPC